MLFQDYQINWDKEDVYIKRGTGIIFGLTKWVIDINIPIFTKDREYIVNTFKMTEEYEKC